MELGCWNCINIHKSFYIDISLSRDSINSAICMYMQYACTMIDALNSCTLYFSCAQISSHTFIFLFKSDAGKVVWWTS